MAELNIPQNSDASKVGEAEKKEKKRAPVVKSGVRHKKKGVGNRVKNALTADSSSDVKGYVIFDVVLPYLKDTLYDAVSGALKMVLFGGEPKSSRRTRRRDGTRSYWEYNNIYADRDDRDMRRRDRDYVRYNKRANMDFTDFVFDSRKDAEEVLGSLSDLVIDEGCASVGDLYDLVGEDYGYNDDNFGWTDLSRAYISSTRDGYIINLPRAKGIR